MRNIEIHIKEICRLATQANSTDDSIDKAHGLNTELGVSLGDENFINRLKEKNILEVALQNYLDQLSKAEIEVIHAVMYSGREDESAIYMKNYFKNQNYQKPDYKRQILERRMNLVTYLSCGVELAKEGSINLNEM